MKQDRDDLAVDGDVITLRLTNSSHKDDLSYSSVDAEVDVNVGSHVAH